MLVGKAMGEEIKLTKDLEPIYPQFLLVIISIWWDSVACHFAVS